MIMNVSLFNLIICCVLKKEFKYTRMQKGKPVYFRLIAADRELAKQVVIIPETRQLK